jgi:lipoprotein-anchoring transpeptidase ErfK/SrfK
MLKKVYVALLTGASVLCLHVEEARAIDGATLAESPVTYAGSPAEPTPARKLYAARSNGGGGFIQFLFGEQQPAYGSPYQVLPLTDPQQMQPRQQDAIDRRLRRVDARYEKQVVDYHGTERPGTIIIDTPSKFLYLVQDNGKALRYGVGVGRPGFTWSGLKTISAKREWPDWTPPAEMLARRPDLPRHMEGGPENPLGARAIYLGSSLYRIHGSNEPWTIGTNVSSGCIRMRNEDVIDLYDRVSVGARVVVI